MNKQKVIDAGKKVMLYNHINRNHPTPEQAEVCNAEMRKVVEFCIEVIKGYSAKHMAGGIMEYSLVDLIDNYTGEEGFADVAGKTVKNDADIVALLTTDVDRAAVFVFTFFLEHVLSTLRIGASTADCPEPDPSIMGLVAYLSKHHGDALSKEAL